jgi:hypothetical protein
MVLRLPKELFYMNIKTKKTLLKIYLFLAVLASVLLTVWRTVLLKEHCNPYDMSFQDGSLSALQAFEYSLLAISALLATSAFFIRKVSFGLFGARASTTSVAVCALCGFMLGAVGILTLFYHSSEIFSFSAEDSSMFRIFRIATIALMFVSALYFLSRASTAMKNSPSVATLSLALPCFCIAYILASYLNSDTPLLDFNRITSELAFISALMFMLSEARLATYQNGYAFRFASSLVCIVCTCSHIVPLLLLSAFWEMSITLSILTDISLIAILLYAVFAAFNAIRTLKETE